MLSKEFLKGYKEIVQEMEVPKSKYNKFGGFYYRSCEDILTAFKNATQKKNQHYSLIVSDEVVVIGQRYYVKATATLTDGENTINAEAYARESQDKKGMDEAQITGGASSYARKYALNGLFNLDDSKDDPDDPETKKKEMAAADWRNEIPKLKTVAEITTYWKEHELLQQDEEFKQLCTKHKLELLDAQKK
jgi:hypothetical protein